MLRGCFAASLTVAALSVAVGQTLTTNPPTTGLSGNFAGIFMDLTAAPGPGLYLNQIDTYMWVTTPGHTAQVWWKPGSYMGHDTNQAAWTHHATITGLTAGGATTPVNLNLPTPILLPANQTIGVYVVFETGGVRYTATAGAQQTFSNADLTLFSERGRSGALFGGTAFTPRVFSGTVHYTPVPEPGTMAALAFGAGLLLRRRRRKAA
jgi:hypothetical protein